MPFKPGQSGNPLGRPKIAVEVRDLARAKTKEAINALVAALKKPGERVRAAEVLLERGYGKPLQPVHLDASDALLQALDGVTNEHIRALIGAVAGSESRAVGEASKGTRH